jgi:hypothetical protein
MGTNTSGAAIIPASTRWASLNLEAPFIKALEPPLKKIDSLVSTVDTIAGVVKTYLNILSKLSTDLLDPSKMGLKATIAAIRAMLEDISGPQAMGVHVIAFPALPSIDPALTPGLMSFSSNPGDDLNAMLAAPGGKLKNVVLGIRGTAGGGGNAGFLQQLNSSLSDDLDSFRPQYDGDAYMAGMVMYFGSETFNSLVSLMAKLAIIFSDAKKPGPLDESLKSLTLPNFPAIRNLKAELTPQFSGTTEAINQIEVSRGPDALAAGKTTEKPFLGVKVSWDTIPSRYYVSPYPGHDGKRIKFKVKNVVLYGDKAPLPTNDPVELEKKRITSTPFAPYTSYVSAAGFKEPGFWYIGAALEVWGVKTEGATEADDILVDQLPLTMTIAQTSLDIPIDPTGPARQGPSPNWIAIRPLALIPALRDLVLGIEDFLDQLEKFIESKSSELQKYIKAITAWVDDYVTWVQSMTTALLNLLQALKDWPDDVFAGVHTFAGKGGNTFMLNSIGQALFDTSDAERPPFDTGTEAVYGIVMVAGSETPGKIESLKTFFENLFNTTFSATGEFAVAGKTVESAIQAAIASIDRVTAETEEEIQLYDNMMPKKPEDVVTPAAPEPASDAQMQPSGFAEGCNAPVTLPPTT